MKMVKMYKAANDERLKMVECGGCCMLDDEGCWNCEQNMFIVMVDHLEKTLKAVTGIHSEFLDEVSSLVLKYGRYLEQKSCVTNGSKTEEAAEECSPLVEQIRRIRELVEAEEGRQERWDREERMFFELFDGNLIPTLEQANLGFRVMIRKTEEMYETITDVIDQDYISVDGSTNMMGLIETVRKIRMLYFRAIERIEDEELRQRIADYDYEIEQELN
jgi:hypothetical protein